MEKSLYVCTVYVISSWRKNVLGKKVTSGSIKIFLFLHLVKYLSTVSPLSHIYNWLLILDAMQLILIFIIFLLVSLPEFPQAAFLCPKCFHRYCPYLFYLLSYVVVMALLICFPAGL